MNGELMIVLIVAIGVFGGLMKARYRALGRYTEQPPAQPTPEADALRREVQALRDRVQVLERVITDTHASSSLDREIEQLRDRS